MPQHERPPFTPLLTIEDLGVAFGSGSGGISVLAGVSLEIGRGEAFGMLGETGAGKSLTAWSAIGLLPFGAERTSGRVVYDGRELTALTDAELRTLRGREIAIVLQNARGALSPTTRIGDQMVNAYRAHVECTRQEAYERALQGLRDVGIPDPERRARGYAHELSLGMGQRVVIAMALLHDPKLLIADEPTSGLDVTIQAQVLDLLHELVREKGTALWLITHDLGVIANYCDQAAVMFAGEVVERCSVADLFRSPRHPYVKGLLDSRRSDEPVERLDIAGPPPDLTRQVEGCRFAYRCPWSEQQCLDAAPPLAEIARAHETRCWVAQEVAAGRRPKPGSHPRVAGEVSQ